MMFGTRLIWLWDVEKVIGSVLWGADRRGFSEFRFLDMCGVRLSVWLSSWGEGLHWRGAFSSHRVLTSGVGWMVSCQMGNKLIC